MPRYAALRGKKDGEVLKAAERQGGNPIMPDSKEHPAWRCNHPGCEKAEV
ncbi:hypothetical protein ACI01nite_21300 [Acetobacter cibinongensis]|uniref:Uncharacterized protein n=1 Tax=Acetobacter cibinongensis TaxID=146475 RepID=A0A0D6N081_9PROT|nr:hypothetical protein Abci_002_027 [Acetobacter cibinongensis]GEL59528.1 hypothetical protein ACI01nite_21300 [Acetobacter cibinongensis]